MTDSESFAVPAATMGHAFSKSVRELNVQEVAAPSLTQQTHHV